MPAARDVADDLAQMTAQRDLLESRVAQLQSQQVRDWLDLIRNGTVVPLHVARSFSWRVTRPFRLLGVAAGLLRREGVATVWATALERLRRTLGRRPR